MRSPSFATVLIGLLSAVCSSAPSNAATYTTTIGFSGTIYEPTGGLVPVGSAYSGTFTYHPDEVGTGIFALGRYFYSAPGEVEGTLDGRPFAYHIEQASVSSFGVAFDSDHGSPQNWIELVFQDVTPPDSASDFPNSHQFGQSDVLVYFYSPTAFSVGQGIYSLATDEPAPVPEPTTWAMMLLGFGAAGVRMRRTRRRLNLRNLAES